MIEIIIAVVLYMIFGIVGFLIFKKIKGVKNANRKTIEIIKKGIKEKTDIAVIGLSGGADSTLVAILCKLALGKKNVYGVHMPYGSVDSKTFNKTSIELAERLGINSIESNIKKSVNTLKRQTSETEISQLNLGNLKSRVRAVTLYTINQSISEQTGKRCRVMGTGNLSEDFIGYDTKGGDALADFFPIGDLFKSEVYQLLEFFRKKKIITKDFINKTPSAGLWSGQTDEEELGYTYDEMQPAIEFLLKYDCFNDDSNFLWSCYDDMIADDIKIPDLNILEFVWIRYLANKHKHEAPEAIKLK